MHTFQSKNTSVQNEEQSALASIPLSPLSFCVFHKCFIPKERNQLLQKKSVRKVDQGFKKNVSSVRVVTKPQSVLANFGIIHWKSSQTNRVDPGKVSLQSHINKTIQQTQHLHKLDDLFLIHPHETPKPAIRNANIHPPCSNLFLNSARERDR